MWPFKKKLGKYISFEALGNSLIRLKKENSKYRFMIIQLLEYWDKPIPQNVRKKAYDLLDEYATE